MPVIDVHYEVLVTAEEEAIFVSACAAGDIGLVGRLHGEGVTSPGALRAACLNGRLDVAVFLMDRGAVPDDDLLRDSCMHGSLMLVELLLSRGASASYVLRMVVMHGRSSDFVELALMHDADPSAVIAPFYGDDVRVLKLLLLHGADPSVGMKHVSALKAVEYLLMFGADPSLGLERACSERRLGVIELLLAHGADPSLGMKKACYAGYLDVVEVIVKHAVARGIDVSGLAKIGLLELYHKALVMPVYERGVVVVSTVPIVQFLVPYARDDLMNALCAKWVPWLREAQYLGEKCAVAKLLDVFSEHSSSRTP